ncbi:hypothetical protein D3C80_2135370 [compost metagenome]
MTVEDVQENYFRVKNEVMDLLKLELGRIKERRGNGKTAKDKIRKGKSSSGKGRGREQVLKK